MACFSLFIRRQFSLRWNFHVLNENHTIILLSGLSHKWHNGSETELIESFRSHNNTPIDGNIGQLKGSSSLRRWLTLIGRIVTGEIRIQCFIFFFFRDRVNRPLSILMIEKNHFICCFSLYSLGKLNNVNIWTNNTK